MIDGVCKDCEERYPACHDKCEKYLKAKAEHPERKSLIYKEKRKDGDFQGYYRDLSRKLRGKK